MTSPHPATLDRETDKPMAITDEMVAAAYNRFLAAINETVPCARCSQRGYHHGFGEDGHDPDWCTVCGGSGFDSAHDEMSAMRLALEAALAS